MGQPTADEGEGRDGGAGTRHGVAAAYRARLAARAEVVAAHERRHAQLAWWRFGIAATAVGLLVWLGRPGLPWLIVPGLAFVGVAIRHALVLNARDRAARAVTFYERGLQRLDDTWPGTGETGERFRSEHHPYADDLDLFGRGSLFELLSSPRTAGGESTLAAWLLAPAPPAVVRERQEAVGELQPKLDLREGLFVFGPDVRAVVDTGALRAWAQSPPRMVSAWPRYVLPVLAALTTAHVGWWVWAGEPPRWLGALLIVQVAFGWWYRSAVREVSEQVERRAQELGVLRDLLAVIEREPVTGSRLTALARGLTATGHVPSVEIGRLVRLADILNTRQNQFFVPIAALFLLGTQTAMGIDRWRARCGAHVPRWLEIAGEYEALAALAGYAAEHPGDPFPEIDAQGPLLEADDLSHPLIPAARAVPNSVRLGGDGPHVMLVSGSNMSGKSTWLRTIGINVVLAQAGAPVRARRMRLSPLHAGATLRIQDSLQAGQSRFFAEITRLSEIVAMARRHSADSSAPSVLFLLDEVLAGTNSHDRRIGAEAIVRGLVDMGAIGLVTTHDLALTDVVAGLGARAANVHFEDRFEGGVLHFDYQLRDGVVKTSNALALMRSVGLDVGDD
ncbi:MAG: DNA mismatch repair protein MutS [Acidobacteria bacterium]|nr:DNA mismatch repair protein MutS [Acidobacteriota bacterium]